MKELEEKLIDEFKKEFYRGDFGWKKYGGVAGREPQIESEQITEFLRTSLATYREGVEEKVECLKQEYKTRKRMTPFQDTLFNHAANVLEEALAVIKN